jgi:hypothetical protein
MRTLKWVLVLTIPAFWVSAARPAEKVVPEGTTVQLLLLRQKSVQEELKLSPDGVKKIMDFTTKQAHAFGAALKLGKTERRAKIKELGNENKQFLATTLTPEQNKRLTQITLQVTGLHQLSRPEVAKVLKLTKDQKQRIKAIQKEMRPKLAQLVHAKSPETRKQLFEKFRGELRKKVRAVLTKSQKAKVKRIVGEPFNGDIVIEGHESAPPGEKSDK